MTSEHVARTTPGPEPKAAPTCVSEAPGSDPRPVAGPLDDVSAIGDAGRQRQVLASPGPLTAGVSDTEMDFFSLGPFELRACSARGLSHRYAGRPRQDAFAVAVTEHRIILAIADGVSQGEHSQVAARVAVETICEDLSSAALAVEDRDWRALADRISTRIVAEAARRGLVEPVPEAAPDEATRVVREVMASTAVLLTVERAPGDGDEHSLRVVVLAGDSGAYRLSSGMLAPLAGGKADDGSGVVSTSVKPLPGPASPSVLESAIRPGEAVFLTSDGIGDPLGDGSNDVGRELARRWTHPPTVAEFFGDVNFFRRTYDDDRTAVGLWVVER